MKYKFPSTFHWGYSRLPVQNKLNSIFRDSLLHNVSPAHSFYFIFIILHYNSLAYKYCFSFDVFYEISVCINMCIYVFKCFLCFFFDFFSVCLFLLYCSSLFVCFSFPLFYYCSFNVCFLRSWIKSLDLDGSRGGKDL